MRTQLVLVTLVAAVIGAIVVAVSIVRDDEPGAGTPILTTQLISTATSVQPQAQLFGERVTARLDIAYDARRIVPGSVRATPRFDPFKIVERRRSRESFGDVVRVRNEYVLQCLTNKCLPPKDGLFTFPRARLAYRPRALPEAQIASVDWPQLWTGTRVGTGDLEGLELAADVRELPPVSYRVPPGTVVAVGYTLAVVAGLAGLVLLAYALGLPGIVSEALARRRARRSPLQRALALVRRATESGEREDSRRALDRLAAELRQTHEPDLAVRATGLAWRRSDPERPSVDPLSDEVERVIEQESR